MVDTWIHKTNYNRQWCLRIYSASQVFIKWLQNKILNYFGVEGKLYSLQLKDRENKIYRLKYGKIAARTIFKQIYYPSCVALERKKLQAMACLQNDNKMVH